jgi:hypothetical protein
VRSVFGCTETGPREWWDRGWAAVVFHLWIMISCYRHHRVTYKLMKCAGMLWHPWRCLEAQRRNDLHFIRSLHGFGGSIYILLV